MSRIYDNVRKEIEVQLKKEAHGAEESDLIQGDVRPVSFRAPTYLFHVIDAMAATMHVSRNSFMVDLLADAMNDAIDGYSAAFGAEHEASARASFFQLVSKFESGLLKPRDIRNQEDDQ